MRRGIIHVQNLVYALLGCQISTAYADICDFIKKVLLMSGKSIDEYSILRVEQVSHMRLAV